MTRLLLAAVVTLAILVILMRLAEFASHRSRGFKQRRSPASTLIPAPLSYAISADLQASYRREKGCLGPPEPTRLGPLANL